MASTSASVSTYELHERLTTRVDVTFPQQGAVEVAYPHQAVIDVDDNPEAPVQEELRRVDGGRDAWVVLIAGFIIEALFWGTLAVECLC